MVGVELSLEPGTVDVYRMHIDNYIVPRIGSEPIRDLTPPRLTRFYSELRKSGGKRGQPLSPRTVKNIHGTVRTAMEAAHVARLIDWNPAASKATKTPKLPENERRTWTGDQVRHFLSAVADDRLFALYVTLACTGLRRGEVCGLRWRDVDLDAGRIEIRRTRVQYGKAIREKGPKTKTSKRDFPAVDLRAIVALRGHKARQLEDRLAAGTTWEGTDRIFTDELGGDLKPNYVTGAMGRAVKRAGLPHLSPHGLRHTFATTALEAGVDVVFVSKLMGHSVVSTTQGLYQHARPEATADAARAIATAILGEQ